MPTHTLHMWKQRFFLAKEPIKSSVLSEFQNGNHCFHVRIGNHFASNFIRVGGNCQLNNGWKMAGSQNTYVIAENKGYFNLIQELVNLSLTLDVTHWGLSTQIILLSKPPTTTQSDKEKLVPFFCNYSKVLQLLHKHRVTKGRENCAELGEIKVYQLNTWSHSCQGPGWTIQN